MRLKAIKTLLLWAMLAGADHALAEPVSEFTLNNGLKILVKPDHRAPVVTAQIWYKVGSSYEPGGYTGMSHVLEHMMFKGTKKIGVGQFSRMVAAQGGRENAFTGRDYTAYFQQLAADRLGLSFRLEADRMQGLLLDAQEFKKELEVVKEERRMRTENNPRARLDEQLMAVTYTSHGYQHPVIGWMEDLDSLTADDLRPWYQRYYAPNNATLVVVGDVNPLQVKKLAEQYYGGLKSRPLVQDKPRKEPPQQGERRIRLAAPAQLPYLSVAYHTPVLSVQGDGQDAYALEVLTALLAVGKSARLEQSLVKQSQVASNVFASYDLIGRAPGLFNIGGTPVQGKTTADLLAALEAEIKSLQDRPVDVAELDKIKIQLAADEVYQQDSGFYQAMKLGMYATVGLDWRMADEYVSRIRAVTPEQVQMVARKYLIASNRSIAELDPLPISPDAAMPSSGETHHVR